jgi:predicted LPLAT superfamily acyltransferase
VPAIRNREEAFSEAVAKWAHELENVLRASWYQWFMFEEMAK